MRSIVTLGLVGLGAQLVDGTLGMAYGVTSTTLLLSAGYAPAAASASVHLAEIGTTLASGASTGGSATSTGRSSAASACRARSARSPGRHSSAHCPPRPPHPWMAGILLALGIYLLLRFSTRAPVTGRPPPRRRFLTPLGLFAGFVDATGGGGWGPVATPTLIGSGRMTPRRVIGTVDTSEFLVALAASLGFLIGIGNEGVIWSAVAACSSVG